MATTTKLPAELGVYEAEGSGVPTDRRARRGADHGIHAVHRFAEPAFAEHQSAALLTRAARRHGLRVRPAPGGLLTAFVADAGSTGPLVAVFAEYDALPGIGHACGHNIIAAAGLGAAAALGDLSGRCAARRTRRAAGASERLRDSAAQHRRRTAVGRTHARAGGSCQPVPGTRHQRAGRPAAGLHRDLGDPLWPAARCSGARRAAAWRHGAGRCTRSDRPTPNCAPTPRSPGHGKKTPPHSAAACCARWSLGGRAAATWATSAISYPRSIP